MGINFNDNLGDLDIELYNSPTSTIPVKTSKGISDNETISLAGLAIGTYYLKVDGYNGSATNPDYTLSLNLPGNKDWAELPTGNDTATTAKDLRNVEGFQTWKPLSIHTGGNEDWFKFNLTKATTKDHYAAILLDQAGGDLDFYLYNSTNTTTPIKSSATGDSLEKIDLSGLAAGTYYVQVKGNNNATNPNYQLFINAPAEQVGDWSEPYNSSSSSYNLREVQGTQVYSGLSLHQSTDEDWFTFTTVGTGVKGHSVSIDFDHTEGNLSLQVIDPNGITRTSASDSNRERVFLDTLPAGTYKVRIYGSANPNYSLIIDAPQTPEADWVDKNTANNSLSSAYNLRTINSTLNLGGLSIHPSGDTDWFKFTLDRTPVRGQAVRIDFNNAEGNLSLELLDGAGISLGTSITTNNFEEISLYDKITQAGKGAGTYYVKVSGSSSTVSNPEYSLTITGIPQLQKDQAEGTNRNDTSATAYDLRNLAEIADSIAARPDNTFGGMSYGYYPGANSSQYDLSLLGADNIFTRRDNLKTLGWWGSGGYINYATAGAVLPPYIRDAQYSFGNQYLASQIQNNPTVRQGLFGRFEDLLPFQQPTVYSPQEIAFSNAAASSALQAQRNFTNAEDARNREAASTSPFFSRLLGIPSGGNSPYSNFYNFFGKRGRDSQNLAVISNLSIQANDQDWFKFTLDKDGEAGQFIAINFDNDLGDLKLELFETSNTTTPVEIANGTGDSEEISLAGLAKGTYYVKVSGATTAITNPDYSLLVNAPPPLETDWIDTQNTSSTAYDLKTVEGNLLLSNLSIHNGDTDTFKFTTISNQTLKESHKVRIDFDHSQGDLDLILKDQNGTELKRSATTADFEEISLYIDNNGDGNNDLQPGTYQIQVVGYNGATNPRYSLSIVAPETIKPDSLEPNGDSTNTLTNNLANATDLSQVSGFKTLGGTIHSSTDQDYFKFTTTGTGTTSNSLSIQFEGAQGDLELALLDINGNPAKDNTGKLINPLKTTNNETISLNGLTAGTYFAKVSGNSDATNNYQLYLDAPTNSSSTPTLNDWTILVYMTGSDLSEYAVKSINEMEMATSQFPGSVNFAVLWDQSSLGKTYATGTNLAWGGTGQAIIQADTNENTIATTFDTNIGELNTGNPTSLTNFITWAKGAAPANHYGLVLWDHGNGDLGGFNLDNEGNRNNTNADKLYTNELTSALQTSGINLDLFAFDACLMGMTEVSYALDPYTQYFVASQEVETAGGYDYTTAFSTLYSNPDQVTAADLASGIVSSYQAKYQGDRRGWDTLSATDTSKLGNFTTKLKAFTDTAIAITNTAT